MQQIATLYFVNFTIFYIFIPYQELTMRFIIIFLFFTIILKI